MALFLTRRAGPYTVHYFLDILLPLCIAELYWSVHMQNTVERCTRIIPEVLLFTQRILMITPGVLLRCSERHLLDQKAK